MLDRLGDPSAHNVIILHGSPGVGKSELAREFARRHRNRYPGGTFLIEAGTNVAKIDLARIGRVFLDLEFASDLRIDDQCLRTLCTLGTTPSLLIFDNIRSIDDARSLMPPAGMPCHVVATTVLDRWDATWQALSVKPLSNKASLELITEIVGRELADRHGEKLATLAGGLPVQLVPASATLAYEARRGRDDAITLTLAQEASESFQGVYKMLEPPARLLLHAAANFNSQRIVRDELEVHLAEAADWSVAEFRDHLDACLDVHVVEGLAELRMHQLFVAFLVKIDPSDEIAASLMRIAKVQAQRFADIAESLVNAPNQADLAATLTTYPVELESWKGPGREILLEKGEVVGGALNVVGRFAAARPWFDKLSKKAAPGRHPRPRRPRKPRREPPPGRVLLSRRRPAQARPWFEQAVEARAQGDIHGRVDHDSLGTSLHEVGFCFSSSGDYTQARPWFEQAVEEARQGDIHGRVDHASLGRSLHLVGVCYSSVGTTTRSPALVRTSRRSRSARATSTAASTTPASARASTRSGLTACRPYAARSPAPGSNKPSKRSAGRHPWPRQPRQPRPEPPPGGVPLPRAGHYTQARPWLNKPSKRSTRATSTAASTTPASAEPPPGRVRPIAASATTNAAPAPGTNKPSLREAPGRHPRPRRPRQPRHEPPPGGLLPVEDQCSSPAARAVVRARRRGKGAGRRSRPRRSRQPRADPS